MTDSFRDTGRPLLVVMADRNSIFVRGLSAFKRRTLYANIINDRTAVYYTTAISRVDPFVDLNAIRVEYIKGYEDVVINSDHPISAVDPAQLPQGLTRLMIDSQGVVQQVPTMLFLTLILPVGLVAFLVNSGIQSIRSNRRIQLHESGKAGIGIANYRIPLMIEEVERAVEGVFKDKRPRKISAGDDPPKDVAAQSNGSTKLAVPDNGTGRPSASSTTLVSFPNQDQAEPNQDQDITKLLQDGTTKFSELSLTKDQLGMIESLDQVGFRKYPVHIRQDRHTHAAIIVRMPKKTFEEGKIVIRHWLENEFDL